METVLFLAHTEPEGSLSRASLEAFAAATRFCSELNDATLTLGLVGENVQPATSHLANCGATRFLGVTGPDFAVSRYATDAAAAEAICRAAQATMVLAPATSRWNRVLPGVAQRLGGKVDTHITGLAASGGVPAANRWYYRQRMEGTLQRTARPWFLLVEAGLQPAWSGEPGNATLEDLAAGLPATPRRTTVLGFREPAGDAQTIRPEAKLLFVTGAGWTKKQADGQPHVKEAERLITDCLRLTRASLGSTKSLVDLGSEGQAVLSFLTHLNQVGQTGSTPRHPKGLATCCHGEEPHTVGWRFVTERRAVNLDPNCGWARGKADVLYVADAFAVVQKVNELLAAQG